MPREQQLQPPVATEPDLPAEFDAGPSLRRGLDATAVRWEGGSGAVNAPHASISESVFDGGGYDAIDLAHAELIDVDLTGVSCATMSLRGARLRRVRLTGGRFGTIDLADAEVDELILDGVRVDYLALGRAEVTDADVRDSRFGSVDAPAARLTRIRFATSEANELDLREARNRDVDLRGLDVTHHLDPRGLAGTTLTELQAQLAARAFADALGVHVRD